MLTDIKVKNYKSIYDSSVTLAPFTLIFGENSSGKTNLLHLIKAASQTKHAFNKSELLVKHVDALKETQIISIVNDKEEEYLTIDGFFKRPEYAQRADYLAELENVKLFSINPHQVGTCQKLIPRPFVQENGHGIVQVLDALKTGDKEELFNQIESQLNRIEPDIKKLILVPSAGNKRLQVRFNCLQHPLWAESLSEGVQRLLIFLTILYQETLPSIICIKNIDRGLHKTLWQPLLNQFFEVSGRENGPQIIATTHNPELRTVFQENGHASAVVVAENEQGRTTFRTLDQG